MTVYCRGLGRVLVLIIHGEEALVHSATFLLCHAGSAPSWSGMRHCDDHRLRSCGKLALNPNVAFM